MTRMRNELLTEKIGRCESKPATGTVCCAVLMPHAPILVPGIGGERNNQTAASAAAMRSAAKKIMLLEPESLVLISPHSPRKSGAFGFWATARIDGSFAQFGAPDIKISLPNDRHLSKAIADAAESRNLQTWAIEGQRLDHGALVPLWFLAEAGWAGPTVSLSLNYPGEGGLMCLGEAIARVAEKRRHRIAVVASGDLSHCLTIDAPCGFHPQARRFDEKFISLVSSGDYRKIPEIDPDLRELAAEDGVDSTVVAAAAANWDSSGHEVLNYESPFGVGYGVAMLYAQKNPEGHATATANPSDKKGGNFLPLVARHSVTAFLESNGTSPPDAVDDFLKQQCGVFVTIHDSSGNLRGCVGTVIPVCSNLVEETWRNARLAAFGDERFQRVKERELDGLKFEVSVLHPPQDAATTDELDPGRYGVIVSATDDRRGVLLPAITEIRTVKQQLALARKKGRIGADEPVKIQRFEVAHFTETS